MTAEDRSWHGPGFPELRARPPWVMEDMILSQTGLAGPILQAPAAGSEAIAAAVLRAAEAGAPVVVTGCGTSEHGAMAVAELLADALRRRGAPSRTEARQALDAALEPRSGGVCIGVSHEGTTRATFLALEAARDAGAATASIGARADSPIALAAEHALTTPLTDGSWCHTVAYTSTILAGAAVARAIAGGPADGGSSIEHTLALRPELQRLAAHIDGASRILSVGLGADLITARELALKIEEGARIPATALHLETLLHGHLAGCDAESTALVLFAADTRQGARRDDRLIVAAGAAEAIGIPAVAIGEERVLAGLPAGVERLSLPAAGDAKLAHALLAGAVSLQLLTLELAHLEGCNPDLIRREQRPYREAAAVAENRGDW
jgi:glucosamine--fructose-6-phosphate aminotransferase (isomerizing)